MIRMCITSQEFVISHNTNLYSFLKKKLIFKLWRNSFDNTITTLFWILPLDQEEPDQQWDSGLDLFNLLQLLWIWIEW